jgi:hypothetical protein
MFKIESFFFFCVCVEVVLFLCLFCTLFYPCDFESVLMETPLFFGYG